jgi:hypothetical protein
MNGYILPQAVDGVEWTGRWIELSALARWCWRQLSAEGWLGYWKMERGLLYRAPSGASHDANDDDAQSKDEPKARHSVMRSSVGWSIKVVWFKRGGEAYSLTIGSVFFGNLFNEGSVWGSLGCRRRPGRLPARWRFGNWRCFVGRRSSQGQCKRLIMVWLDRAPSWLFKSGLKS